jgi:Resolvase, N terminal domain
MSAYWGRNAAEGALAAFLQATKDGLVPTGSRLIVESLDRISRQTVRKAVRTLEDIVEAGVNVVDLEDAGRVYNIVTLDTDGIAFLIMVIRFMRANQESVLKGDRVRRAYDYKRHVAAARQPTDKPFTRILRAWLYWDGERNEYGVHTDRAVIVRSGILAPIIRAENPRQPRCDRNVCAPSEARRCQRQTATQSA